MKKLMCTAILASTLGLPFAAVGGTEEPAIDPVATFSILGYDPESGLLGAAVQSRVFSVGNGVLWAEAGVGIVATGSAIRIRVTLTTTGRNPDDNLPSWMRVVT